MAFSTEATSVNGILKLTALSFHLAKTVVCPFSITVSISCSDADSFLLQLSNSKSSPARTLFVKAFTASFKSGSSAQ